MAFQHPTALGRVWTLGTTVSGHDGARGDAAAGTANATTATTATRAAVASRLPRTIAPCTPGRRRACRRRDTPYADNRRSRGRAGPVRESQHTAHRHRPQVSAEVAPSTSRIARTRDNPPRSTTGRDMRMGHPAFSLRSRDRLPPSDCRSRARGHAEETAGADAGSRTTIYHGELVLRTSRAQAPVGT